MGPHLMTTFTGKWSCVVQRAILISGTGADISSKTNFGPTGHHHSPTAPFSSHAPFPALLPFFKCVLEVAFCEAVLHRPRFCLKMVAFQFYLQWRGKVWWVGDDSHVDFGNKKPLVKKEVSYCKSQYFCRQSRGEVFSNIHAVTVKYHSSMQSWLFGLPGRDLCEQSPWCQVYDEQLSSHCSPPVSLFRTW
jgi:hypothetical protein